MRPPPDAETAPKNAENDDGKDAFSGAWGAARAVERAQLAAAAIGVVLLFAVVPHALTGDGQIRYAALSDFERTGELRNMLYSYVGPLFASPFLLLDGRSAEMWWIARFNVIVLAAGLALVWWSLRGVLPPIARSSFVALLAAGGMMPNHVRDFYGEVFTATFVAGGLLLVIARGKWVGWIAVGLGVANTPGTAVGLVLVAIWRFARTRRFDGAIAVAFAAALIVGENLVVRGELFASGYEGARGLRTVMPFSGRPGFSYPLLFGLLSLVFSFGKGLLFFAPGLLLIREARRLAGTAIANVLDAWTLFLTGMLIVYAQWWAWYGGWYWGPRFLLIAVFPSALALALVLTQSISWRRLGVAMAVTAWTVWVGVSGIAFPDHGLDVCMADSYALEHLCWFTPEFSPLFRPLVIGAPSHELWQRAWILLAVASAAVLLLPPITLLVKRFPPRPSS